jgi:hypothetical protein
MPNHALTQAVVVGQIEASEALDVLFDRSKWFVGWLKDNTAKSEQRIHLFFESMITRTEIEKLLMSTIGLPVTEYVVASDAKLALLFKLRHNA